MTMDEIFFAEFNKDLEKLGDSQLVHYCSLPNVKSILDSKEFWMSSVLGMNDFSEVSYSVSLFARYFSNKDNELAKALAKVSKEMDQDAWNVFLVNHLQGEFARNKFHAYITCLTAHETNREKNHGKLSMWRCYGNNGVALLFSYKENINIVSQVTLTKVHYLEYCGLEELIDDMASRIINNQDYLRDKSDEELKSQIAKAIMFAVISIKHPGFEEENEWRLVYYDTDLFFPKIKTSVEIVNGGLRNIAKLDISQILSENLAGIMIGPSINVDATEYALTKLIKKIGHEKRVYRSNIPVIM